MLQSHRKHIKIEIREPIAIIWLDTPNSKVNVLSRNVSHEFEEALESLSLNDRISAMVLISAKEDNFIAGADIQDFKRILSVHEATELSLMAQSLMNRIESSKKPIICAIHGACLGGGLEAALACQYRIATDDPKTQLALPEVLLGLLPGAGGTQRLPRLIGLSASLDMLLSGRKIRAKKAKSLGLVDYIATPHGLVEIAVDTAKKLVNGEIKPLRKSQATRMRALERGLIGKFFISLAMKKAKKQVLQKTFGLYPAPLRILEVVETGLKKGLKAGFALEAKRFGELTQTEVSKNLVELFFLQTMHKKNLFSTTKHMIERIGMIGAGFMGAGIASVSAQNGFVVYLNDSVPEHLRKAEQTIWRDLSAAVKKQALKEFERSQILSRVFTENNYSHLHRCDLVIEAIFEDLNTKQKMLTDIEPYLSEHCIFASNTSALPISAIGQHSARKDRIIGMHYFSPVQKMPLLEIVVTPQTSRETTGLAIDVGLKQKKTIIVVKDSPGFFSTRILSPFLDEATILALEGVDLTKIDEAMQLFGFPVGPITLMDEVGLDGAHHVGKELANYFGSRFTAANWNAIAEIMDAGFLGRKSGKGFYTYENPVKGKIKRVNEELRPILQKYKSEGAKKIDMQQIQFRVALRMMNEGIYCLQENVLSNPGDGDLGAVFGLGFPACHGGPFRYVDHVGASKVLSQLQHLSDELGERFSPAPLLVDKAKGGKKFHKSHLHYN